MRLSPRLKYIFSFTEKSAHTADVGTDHGRIAAALLLWDRAKRVTASDISEQSLSKAAMLIRRIGIEERASLVCTDGLSGLENKGIDQVVIAGMGGELIRDIIIAAPWVKTDGVRLVLQPMSLESKLRSYLFQNEFNILRQGAVIDGGRAYEVLAAVYDGKKRWCGPFDSEVGSFEDFSSPAAVMLLKDKREKLKKHLIGAEKTANREEEQRIKTVIAEIDKRLEG